MIRETSVSEAEFHGAAGVIHGFPAGVAAKRRVHVIIRGQFHEVEC
jgi:hypothetical protein